MVLDHKGEIFICLTLLLEQELRYYTQLGRWVNMATMQVPLVFHGNGDDGSLRLMNMMNS